MAKEMGKSNEPEVSNCVSGLIRAFTDSLNVFKKLRSTRRKRKDKRHADSGDRASNPEIQLSKSLRKGPKDIEKSYNLGYSQAGDRFAKGDAIAHASLTETLLKLNAGLVGIINAFLHHDPKSSPLNLDYRSLTCLSDASRAEAVSSLNMLCQRLSQSQVNLHVQRIGACPRCGSTKHYSCSDSTTKGSEVATKSKNGEKRRHPASKSRPSGPTVAKMHVKGSSQPQLVVLRPKNNRHGSSTSSSSTKSHTVTTASSPSDSPLGSPLPQYSPRDPFPPQKVTHTKPNQPNQGRRRAGSFDGPRPTTWPHAKPDSIAPFQPLPPPMPQARNPNPRKAKLSSSKEKPSSPGVAPVPIKRRADKVTPSTYTFASDSTKLGEIPEAHWATPFNYEEAERLNAEAAISGHPSAPVEDPKAKKKGLFKFLRRGSGA